MQDFSKVSWLKWLLIGLVELVILLLVFRGGEIVGFRKASFSYGWGENYRRNFGGPGMSFVRNLPPRSDFLNPHGVSGSVLKIDGNTIVAKGQDNIELTLVTDSNTVIRRQDQTIKITDIKTGDQVTAIGSPNSQGQIEAKFVRVFGK